MSHADALRARADSGGDADRLELAAALLDEGAPDRFDPFEALYWLERCDDPEARFRAGVMWGTGLGCGANLNRAREHLDAAARRSHAGAALQLAYCLEQGLGGPRDAVGATRLLRQAARQGAAGALACLGWRYEAGHTFPRDTGRAATCYARAAEAGHPTAGDCLTRLDTPPRHGDHKDDATEPCAERARPRPAPTRRVIAWRPRAFAFDDFLSPEECLLLIGAALPRLKPSRVVRQTGAGDEQPFGGRSSGEMAFVAPHKDLLVCNVERRIAHHCLIPAENGEPLVVLRYGPGDEYVTHTDYCDPASPAARQFLQRGGQRVATFLMYLNDVTGGGETAFPATGARVSPSPGRGFLFWNVLPDGDIDTDSRHAGLPVHSGQKWLASKWIRQYAPRPMQPRDPRYAVGC